MTIDHFSYNVFSVSRADLALITHLQREHFQRIRTIVANSPAETVALINVQICEWVPAEPHRKEPRPRVRTCRGSMHSPRRAEARSVAEFVLPLAGEVNCGLRGRTHR